MGSLWIQRNMVQQLELFINFLNKKNVCESQEVVLSFAMNDV